MTTANRRRVLFIKKVVLGFTKSCKGVAMYTRKKSSELGGCNYDTGEFWLSLQEHHTQTENGGSVLPTIILVERRQSGHWLDLCLRTI